MPFVLALLACSRDEEPSSEEAPDGLVRVQLTNQNGEQVTLNIEVPDTPEAWSKGLSNRDSLGADNGMLFLVEGRILGFSMRDTRIPLSIAFINACGEIVDIEHMEPLSTRRHNTGRRYRFGLEVNQGWFERNDLGVGDHLSLPEALLQPDCAT